MNALTQFIQHSFGLEHQALEQMAAYFKPETIRKGDHFLRQGAYCTRLSFVESGLLRMYRIHHDREVTHWISGPGQFATDIQSYTAATPARWDIIALTDTRIHTLHQHQYQKLGLEIPQWHLLEKQFLAHCFATLEERMFDQLSLSAEQRYARLLDQQPQLIREVPLQHLASMLGITPETLSRIRSQHSRRIS